MMKKRLFRATVAVLTVCLMVPLMSSMLVGCGKKPPATEPTVESIALDYSAAKTQFEWGEAFSTDGLKVKATMSDGSEKEVPLSDCAVTKPVWDLPGNKFIRVMYQGKSATYTVVLKERVMPALDKTPLLTVTGETPNAVFTVEAEDINFSATGVQASGGTLVAETQDESVSGGKYITNYGVKNNYFGFTFNVEHEQKDVTLVLHAANAGESVLSLNESFKLYLNYKGVAEDGAIDLKSVPTLPAMKDGQLQWQARAIRGLTLPQGENTLSFDVTSSDVPCIDKIELYVGRRFISDSSVEITEHKTYVKEFEDFNLEKVLVRPDMMSGHDLKPGELYTEVPGKNLENTSGGKSTGGLDKGSEVSTVIRTNTDIKVDISLAAAYPIPYKIADSFEFFIDGEKLTDVEDKDIMSGTVAQGEWWNWQDTYLGRVTLAAGEHIFDVRSTKESCNLDCFKFKVVTGQLPDGENHVCTHICPRCSKCNDECTHSDCAEKCECGHICEDECDVCHKCLTDCTETNCEEKCECAENLDATISKLGAELVEAENLDNSGVKTQPDQVNAGACNNGEYVVKDDSTASGGKRIYGLDKGTEFTIRVKVEQNAKVTISVKGYCYMTDYPVNDTTMLFWLDGEQVADYDEDTNMRGTNADWQTVTAVKDRVLTAGVHTFKFKLVRGSLDLDCITLDVTEYGA